MPSAEIFRFSSRALLRRADVFDLGGGLRCGRARQLVALPELVNDLLFLHLGGVLPRVEAGALALHVEDLAALVLRLLLVLRAARLNGSALGQLVLQRLALCLAARRAVGHGLLALRDLIDNALIFGFI